MATSYVPWVSWSNRVPRSRKLRSGAARGPEDTGPLGRGGGGGVALPPRPRPGSRLCLPPRKTGAAASSSFRFPLAPSLGPSCAKISVLCGRRRTLRRARPPPGSSPGAARRPARRSRPAPAARSRPLAGPFRSPGTCGQWAAGQPVPGLPSYRSRTRA